MAVALTHIDTGGMPIHRHDCSAPGAARSRRHALAGIVVALVLAVAAVPVIPAPGAFAADPTPAPSAAPDPSASPVPSAAPSASRDPSASPAPSASPDPSVSPEPSATPSPTPVPSPSPTPAWSSTITTIGASVTFYGRGYGHGVGLNQYGARGRALAGQTSEQILAAYFKGTALSSTSPLRAVRVLLMAGFAAPSSSPLVVYGRGGAWGIAGVAATFPVGAVLRAWRTTATVDGVARTTWRIRVNAPDGTQLHAAIVSGVVTVLPADPAAFLQLYSKPSTYDTYRGSLQLRLSASSMSVVNRLGLDDYLKGVVPVEMPSSWPVEALKAQAVAARSYAVRRLHPTTGSYDLFDDTRSQVYRGLEAERTITNDLITAAPGAILKSGTAVANTFFFSTGGGWTENNEYAFVPSSGTVSSTPVSYLRGTDDRAPDGIAYDAAAPYAAWTTGSVSAAQLTTIFGADSRTAVGSLLRLNLTRRGVSGRLVSVTLYGTAGTRTVSADVFRAVFNLRKPAGVLPLRSNLFDAKPLS